AAPAEYRGEFRPIRTSVPGVEISEHLPRLARLAHRFALVRSVHHTSPGHINSTHTMMSGYPGELVEAPPYRPRHPDLWAVAHRHPRRPAADALQRLRLPRLGARPLRRRRHPGPARVQRRPAPPPLRRAPAPARPGRPRRALRPAAAGPGRAGDGLARPLH